MKKIILALLALIVVGVLGVVALASGKPDVVHVERSIVVDATAADVAPFVEDLVKVNAWSPWEKRDPNMTKEYSDVTTGVGAWYSWSGNDDVGVGKQTITSVEPGKVVQKLEFFEPFASEADSTFAYAEGPDGVKVTWGFDQEADFMGKVMAVFMDMDAMIGPDFEEGLGMLKPLAEEAAAKRIADEKEAAANAAKAAAEAAAEEAEDGEGEAAE